MSNPSKKWICLLVGIITGTFLNAQSVGIGTTIPNASAILDIQSTGKGILLPRLTLGQMVGINNPENGLLIFNTGNNRFFYNTGTKAAPSWRRLETDADFSADNLWLLTGNNNINPVEHYLGNSEAIDIRFRANNSRVGIISASNNSLFLGTLAGNEFATGLGNVAIGNAALQANTNGSGLVAIGSYALSTHDRTDGYNVAIGKDALRNCNTCTQSVALGYEALKNSSGTATANVAVGYRAMNSTNKSSRNTAAGVESLEALIDGNNNVVIGSKAGHNRENLSNITLFGGSSTASNGITNSTAIGNTANVINSNSVALGNEDVESWVFGLTKPSAANRVLEVGSTFANGNGAYLSTSGVWVNVSDVNKKQNIKPIDGKRLLQNLAALPVTQWRYKGSPDWHIGPMAQDFKALFNLGDDDKAITTVDASGVALAAIQQLMQENEWLEERVRALENRKK